MYITLTWMPAFATLPLCGALPMRAQCCSLPAPMSIYNRRRLPAPGKYGTFPLRAQCCSLPAPMSINVSSTNYSTQYQRLRLPSRRGELAYGFVPRILYRSSSLKFTTLFSSNSRSIITADAIPLPENAGRGWLKSHEVTATGGSEIPLIGGAGG